MVEKLVVIGNGMAPGRMLEHLFATAPGRFDVTIFNAEPRVNYNRLMLSPVLSGEKTYADIITHDDDWYATHGVTLHKSSPVTSIDRVARTVTSSNGLVAPYDKLVIATGSSPFIPPLPGHLLDNVVTYRDLDDVEKMLAACQRGGRAVVLGGGVLGLEAAAGLNMRGMDVTVLHLGATLMQRQLDATAGHLLQDAFLERGIKVMTRAVTKEILGTDRVEAVRLEDGTQISADLFVMAVGIRPTTGLAKAAGLAVNRGIVVDDQMRTDDPHIYALGECVEHRGVGYGLIAPLYEMAQVLAKTLIGEQAAYQGSVTSTKLKVTGIDLFSAGDFSSGEDREEIALRDVTAGIYKRLVLKDDRIIGAVLYGETADGPWFFDLLHKGTDTREMRDTLIFGQAYQGGAKLDPMEAVAALPDDIEISCCNGLTDTDVLDAPLRPCTHHIVAVGHMQ